MNLLWHELSHSVIIGIGATLFLDLWLLLLSWMKLATLNFRPIGRWIGYMPRGRFKHEAIAMAPPVRGELALGWATHYAVGIVFALLLVGFYGPEWTRSPSLLPAVTIGVGTVIAPVFIMQPAIGAGIAFRRTATPVKNCVRSLVNHAVFGAGLYLSARIIASILG
jgi:hypothetical protein